MIHRAVFMMTVLFRTHPVNKFDTYTFQGLLSYAQHVCDALIAASSTFTNLPVSTADLQTAINDYKAAVLAWGVVGNRGSHLDHVNLVARRADLEELLRAESDAVDTVAAGRAQLISLAGMVAKQPNTPIGQLAAVANLRSVEKKNTPANHFRLVWKKLRGAKAYLIFSGATADPSQATFLMATTQSKAVFAIDGVAYPDARYFWVAAVGAAGTGVWSDMCEARAK